MGKLDGYHDLKRYLDSLPDKLQRQALRPGTRAAAHVVAEDARRLAPRDTGALEQSIKVRAMRRSRTRMGHSILSGAETLGSTVDAERSGLPFYAFWVEFGTVNTPADPFLRPALWGNRAAIFAAVRRAVEQFVAKQKNKATKVKR